MEILITNDDGWGSKGIITLARLMSQLGHVTVLAPDGARSGMSSAITVQKPMTLRKVGQTEVEQALDLTLSTTQGVDVYVTNGTPSDCIKLALEIVYKGIKKPDLVVSGINHGSNAAINIIYSGTIGACLVAAEHEITSIGFSIQDHNPDADFHYMEPFILETIQTILKLPPCYGRCYNVNAPIGPIEGIRWTRQCKGHWQKEIETRVDEQGDQTYWLIGEFINHEPQAEDTDEWALSHHFLSIQPATVDMTDYEAL